MLKKLLFVACTLSLCLALTDREILQQGLNGVTDQNKQPQSTTIIPCASDSSATLIVKFISTSLAKAAKGSLTDLISLISDIKNFINELPESERQCALNSPETQTLAKLYNIDPNDSTAIEKKALAYLSLHFLTVHKWMVDLDDTWNSQKNYYQTGFKGAGYAHNVFNMIPMKLLQKAHKIIVDMMTERI